MRVVEEKSLCFSMEKQVLFLFGLVINIFCDHLKLAEETLSLSPKDLGTLGGVRAVWPVLSPVNEVSVAPL